MYQFIPTAKHGLVAVAALAALSLMSIPARAWWVAAAPSIVVTGPPVVVQPPVYVAPPVVYPVRPPIYVRPRGPVWIPGHWNGLYWAPAHWD